MPKQAEAGRVYLIGAGPGDPGLLTLRGAECLGRADVVLYDYLVNPRMLVHARADAEKICLGRHGQGRIWPQAEINQTLVELARQQKSVARLKGGDPAVFARGAEEIEALVAEGIPFEIVPGITAALAASSYAGIPVTHRDLASAVALVTGQEADKDASQLDFAALAQFPGTLVYYMGVTTAEHWVAELIAAGKPANTPAAILRRCSWPDQQLVHCSLGEIPARLAGSPRVRPPAIIILGEVVGLSDRLSWFDRRPLFGLTVLVTRPDQQVDSLTAALEEAGAEVLWQPAIEITAPEDWDAVDEAIARCAEFDWVVFTSGNGVCGLLDRVSTLGLDTRALAGPQLAAVGPGTAEALQRYGLRADLQPARHRAEELVAAFEEIATGQRFLWPRGSRGRQVLANGVQDAGGVVESIVVYQSKDVASASSEISDRLRAGEIDWVTVTSPAIANSLIALFGEELHRCRLATISPLTSEALRTAGYTPQAEATEYTMAGLVAAIRDRVAGTRESESL